MSKAGGVPQKPFELPDGATEIILVRHGASADAMPGAPFPLIDGRGDPPLSQTGRRQAEAVLAALPVAARDPIIRRVFEEERWDHIPGAESPESLTDRVRAGIEEIVEATGPDAVAVAVLHGGVIGEACRSRSCTRTTAPSRGSWCVPAASGSCDPSTRSRT